MSEISSRTRGRDLDRHALLHDNRSTRGALAALDEHRRGEVGHELQATLVELVDLSLIGSVERRWLNRIVDGSASSP